MVLTYANSRVRKLAAMLSGLLVASRYGRRPILLRGPIDLAAGAFSLENRGPAVGVTLRGVVLWN